MRKPDRSRTLVLSLNPAIDLEWQVPQVHWEEKNAILAERRWAGGKGVNVARWLKRLGGTPRLLVALGGLSGSELNQHTQKEKLSTRIVSLRQATRVDVIITTAEGRQLRFNPRGPMLSHLEWQSVECAIRQELKGKEIMVLSGSLPQGATALFYTKYIKQARRQQIKTLLDCDGPAFAEGIAAKPFLVKPNEHELSQWIGQRCHPEAKLLRAARALASVTEGWVFVSRGKAGGLLVNAVTQQTWWATPPSVTVLTTNGAGDALLAAVARRLEMGESPEAWLRWGIAAGTAATQCLAGEVPAVSFIKEMADGVQLRLTPV